MSKTSEITDLVLEGKALREIIEMGYEESRVYTVRAIVKRVKERWHPSLELDDQSRRRLEAIRRWMLREGVLNGEGNNILPLVIDYAKQKITDYILEEK